LVDEIILYYDARSKGHQITVMAQISFEALIDPQLIKKVTPSTEPETSSPFSQEKLKLSLCK